MHDICTYHIEVKGEVDETTLNAASPIQMRVQRRGTETSCLAIQADQSGFIGLMRHLHQQGFVLLSVSREHFSKIS